MKNFPLQQTIKRLNIQNIHTHIPLSSHKNKSLHKNPNYNTRIYSPRTAVDRPDRHFTKKLFSVFFSYFVFLFNKTKKKKISYQFTLNLYLYTYLCVFLFHRKTNKSTTPPARPTGRSFRKCNFRCFPLQDFLK